jgi:hypothetical protein
MEAEREPIMVRAIAVGILVSVFTFALGLSAIVLMLAPMAGLVMFLVVAVFGVLVAVAMSGAKDRVVVEHRWQPRTSFAESQAENWLDEVEQPGEDFGFIAHPVIVDGPLGLR